MAESKVLLPGSVRSDLPIGALAGAIAAAIRSHRALVVVGETGSGKSTQLPRIVHEALGGARIVQTQPRRIGARSVAARIAEEAGVELGGMVGYRTRFEQRSSRRCLLEVVTDGLLLARLRDDPLLSEWGAVIVDEAHERSLNIDFLLGCLRRIIDRRDDLRVVVSSATIDAGKFSEFLGGCPIVEASGRLHPIEVRQRPPEESVDGVPPLAEQVLQAVDECLTEPSGVTAGEAEDILVFLPGERDIFEAVDAIRARHGEAIEVLPLYSRLPVEQQDRIFRPASRRRVVLATNIAETSLTVPRIRYVIDSGVARIARYSAKARIQRLPIEEISQASANQRAGRCGRIGPGICIRLYSAENLASRPEHTQPEIRRTNLAGALLQMKALNLGRPDRFPFLDAPSLRAVEDAEQTLFEIGACGLGGRLTACGTSLAKMNIDPRLAKLVYAARSEGCTLAAVVVAAYLSVQDPRERPLAQAGAADIAHTQFQDPRSDAGSALKLWTAWQGASDTLGSSALRRWCRDRFLSHRLLREWTDVAAQLERAIGSPPAPETAEVRQSEVQQPDASLEPTEGLHRALLAAFISNAALRTEKGPYKAVSGAEFLIHPGSALVSGSGHWIVAAEIVETTRRLARFVVKIRPDWIERVASHMVTRTVSEPHWIERSGQVGAWERVSCGSLTLIPRRRCPFGPTDAAAARDIFIQGALVDERVTEWPVFLRANRALRDKLQQESSVLRREVLLGTDAIQRFYDGRIPATIHSMPSLLSWLKSDPKHDQLLRMAEVDLRRPDASAVDPHDFPVAIQGAGIELPLSYRHSPGDASDGPSVKIPLWAVAAFDPQPMEWLVPGLLPDKVAALVKSLPKRARVRFQPISEYVSGAVDALSSTSGSLFGRLATHLSQVGGLEIAEADFDRNMIPAHLQMQFEVVDGAGAVLWTGRDWLAMPSQTRESADAAFLQACRSELGASWLESDLVDFPHRGIPESLGGAGKAPGVVYPALQLTEGKVDAIVVATSADVGPLSMPACVHLLVCRHRNALLDQIRNHPLFQSTALTAVELGGSSWIESIVSSAVADSVLRQPDIVGSGLLIRSPETFARASECLRAELWQRVHTRVTALHTALRIRQESLRALSERHPPTLSGVAAECQDQLAQLWSHSRFSEEPEQHLASLARWTQATQRRWQRAVAKGVAWDTTQTSQLRPWQMALATAEREANKPSRRAALRSLRRLLEEFAVSLYAQELGTTERVSAGRLQRAFIEAGVPAPPSHAEPAPPR